MIKCDNCGKFLSYDEIAEGRSKVEYIPDSHFTIENVAHVCHRYVLEESENERKKPS